MMIKNKKKNTDSGFIILFAVTLSSILLSIALGVANVAFQEVSFSTSARNSNDAFLASDTGAECALFHDRLVGTFFPITGPATAITCGSTSITPIYSGTANASACASHNVTSTGAGTNTGCYNFVITGLGSSGNSCTKVAVFKDRSSSPMLVSITSSGYNIGAAGCNSTNPKRVERELKITSAVGIPPVYTPPSITVDLSCSGTCILSSGQDTTLSWTTTGATGNCTATGGWSGSKSTSGNQTFAVLATTTYNLTCSGSGSSASDSVTVTVISSPTVVTNSASAITSSSATLSSSTNSNGASTTGWFRYSKGSPGASCNDTDTWGGQPATSTVSYSLGSGASPVTYSNGISGLTPPSITYYYCAIASNSSGTTLGNVVPFTTTASGANVAPSADAGPDKVITFPAATSAPTGASEDDPDGTIASRLWSFVSGPGPTPNIANRTTLSPSFSGMTSAGTYVFLLTVTDNKGATGTNDMQVTVNTPPVADAGSDQTIQLPVSSVTMAGTASDPDPGNSVSTLWTKYSGPTETIVTPSSLTTNITVLSAGTYVFRLTVTDNHGATHFSDMQVVVLPGNALPTVTSPTVSAISQTGATLGANVTSLGYPASITARGTCWGTSPAPTTNCTAEGGTTTGTYTHARTGLPTSTFIYYRGYAINSTGTGYSTDGTFTTPPIIFVAANSVAGASFPSGLPTHQAGDLIIIFAYRDGDANAPTLPSGWNIIGSASGAGGSNKNSSVMAYRVATASGTASGTLTNATELVVQVYRGASSSSPIGAQADGGSTGTTVTYPALSLNVTNGSSRVAGFAGHQTAAINLQLAPTGMTNRTSASGTGKVAGHGTSVGVVSWSATNVTLTGTSAGWRARTVEIKSN